MRTNPTNNPEDPKPESAANDAFSRRWVLVTLIFVALGVFTIPLIRKSRLLGRKEKIFWSVVAALYTLAVLVLGAWLLHWQVQVMLEQLNVLRQQTSDMGF